MISTKRSSKADDPQRPAGTAEASSRRVDLHSAAVTELRNFAAFTALSTSLVNEMWRTSGHRAPAALGSVIPAIPTLLREALLGLGTPNSADLLRSYDRAIEVLGAVRKVARVLIIAPGTTNAMQFELMSLLCSLSSILERLVRELASTYDDAGSGQAIADAMEISALLRRCAAGESPCAAFGALVYPNWHDRRGERRFSVHMRALLIANRHLVPVMLMDASRSGLGLRGMIDIAMGRPVTVKLWNGRQFDGTIAWRTDANAGVRLHRALAHDDPLISCD